MAARAARDPLDAAGREPEDGEGFGKAGPEVLARRPLERQVGEVLRLLEIHGSAQGRGWT